MFLTLNNIYKEKKKYSTSVLFNKETSRLEESNKFWLVYKTSPHHNEKNKILLKELNKKIYSIDKKKKK